MPLCCLNLVPTDMNLDYCLDLLYFHLVLQTTSSPAHRRHTRGRGPLWTRHILAFFSVANCN